jgi:hypothetical protein
MTSPTAIVFHVAPLPATFKGGRNPSSAFRLVDTAVNNARVSPRFPRPFLKHLPVNIPDRLSYIRDEAFGG